MADEDFSWLGLRVSAPSSAQMCRTARWLVSSFMALQSLACAGNGPIGSGHADAASDSGAGPDSGDARPNGRDASTDSGDAGSEECTPALVINFNFRASEGSELLDYIADTGDVFGDHGVGRSFGWDIDVSGTARDRAHARAQDDRYDTLVHMQHSTLPSDASWEVEVPNGEYDVRVVAGDPAYADGIVHRIEAEGLPVVDGVGSVDSVHWVEGEARVTVSDGRLTLSNGEGAANNRLAFVEIHTAWDTDCHPPSPPASPAAISRDASLRLEWTNTLYDAVGVVVLQSTTEVSDPPVRGVAYAISDTIGSSRVAYVGSLDRTVVADLANDVETFFRIFTVDSALNYSTGVGFSGTPRGSEALDNLWGGAGHPGWHPRYSHSR